MSSDYTPDRAHATVSTRSCSSIGDAEIRPALRSHLLANYAGEGDTVILEEIGICRGQARVDFAVVNGQLHAYEIKSDLDTLRRLDGQVSFYSRVFDRSTLVVGDRFLTEAVRAVPKWWGVLRFFAGPKGLRFKTLRRGRMSPHRDPRSLVELLWLDDAIALLAQRDAARGVRGKPRCIIWDRVCDHFEIDEIAAAVRAQLKARSARQDPARPL